MRIPDVISASSLRFFRNSLKVGERFSSAARGVFGGILTLRIPQ